MLTNRLLVLFILFSCNIVYAQVKSKPITKLFFEYGFENCKVSVSEKNNILFNGNLTSQSQVSGCTKIVEIKKLKRLNITINACGRTKLLSVRKSKFYIINIKNNTLVIEEVDEEPIYI